MAATRHYFDTGKFWICPLGHTFVGDSTDNAYLVGEVQKVSFSGTYKNTDLRSAASVSKWAVDVGHTGGEAKLSIEVGDFNHPLVLPWTTGAAADTAYKAGWITYTVGGASGPVPQFVVFEGIDTGGKHMRILMEFAYAPGHKEDFALGNFVMPSLDVNGYDRTNAAEATPAYRLMFES